MKEYLLWRGLYEQYNGGYGDSYFACIGTTITGQIVALGMFGSGMPCENVAF